jgi:uncharacterized circularly permuted ATP-grasp superfamily protein
MSRSEPASLNPSLLGDYAPLPGTFDELLGPEAALRSQWDPFISSLQRLTPEELSSRQDNTRRVIREHGATYNVYSEPDSLGRAW